jgi:hypothetical protein
MMSQENLLMTAELEDNYGNENEEEAFKEEFNHPTDGALHWLPLVLTGLRQATSQAFVVGYGGHTDSLLRRFVHGI